MRRFASAGEDDVEAAPLVERSGTASTASTAPKPDADGFVDWTATGLCFLFPAMAGLLFGYDIGATSGSLLSLTSEKLSGTDWYQLTPFQSGLVVSVSLLGALAGSLVALAAGNRVGRRTELLLASLLYGVSATGMGFSGSLEALLAARAMYGLGIGFAMHAAPAYIAETSPPNVRGLLISLKEAAIVLGILAGYLSGYFFVDTVGGWRSMYGVAAPVALALGLGAAALPESPRWLLLSGAPKPEACRALAKAEGRRAADPSVVEARVDAMAAAVAEDAALQRSEEAGGAQGGGLGALLTMQRYRRPLLVGMSLMLFQQVTGQPSVLYYASKIFEDAGFAGGQEAAGVSVILGSFKLVMTLAAVATVDSWGRRPLLLAGVSAMSAALLVLSAAEGSGLLVGSVGAWASLGALLLYVGAYQMSFGPISWLIVGEVFPLAVRGQALALATFVNFGSNFLVSLALPSVQEAVGPSGTYLGFASVGVVAVASIYLTLPETKGKTLEEIEAIWQAPSPPRGAGGETRR